MVVEKTRTVVSIDVKDRKVDSVDGDEEYDELEDVWPGCRGWGCGDWRHGVEISG
jgi:hypothetical protein